MNFEKTDPELIRVNNVLWDLLKIHQSQELEHPIYNIQDIKKIRVEDFKTEEAKDIFSDLTYGTSKSKIKQALLQTQKDLSAQIFTSVFESAPIEIKEIFKALNEIDGNFFLVGGSVRDALLGNNIKDFDLTTSLDYNHLKTILEGQFDLDIRGEHFKVLIVKNGKEEVEIAQFRKDGTYSDGRRPDSVSAGTIFDDAARRDFTINAGYWDIKDFKLLDPTGEFIDAIQKRELKFIGNAEDRLQEDHLRGLRFYRFLATKGLKADKRSLKAVRKNMGIILSSIDPQRATNEIEKIVGV